MIIEKKVKLVFKSVAIEKYQGIPALEMASISCLLLAAVVGILSFCSLTEARALANADGENAQLVPIGAYPADCTTYRDHFITPYSVLPKSSKNPKQF